MPILQNFEYHPIKVPIIMEKNERMEEMEKELPSNLTIICKSHGEVKLSQVELDKQTKKGQLRCPGCGKIPIRILRK